MGKYVDQGKQPPHCVEKDDPLAISLLKEEHQVFRRLFDEAENAKEDKLVDIAQEACMRLGVHMTIEEEIFYPATKGIDKKEVDEGIVEHAASKKLISEIEQLNGTEELYKSKVHVLGEEVVHHIREEEEELFESAKKAQGDGKIDLDAIGEKLRARRRDLYDHLARTGDEGKTCEAVAEEIPSV